MALHIFECTTINKDIKMSFWKVVPIYWIYFNLMEVVDNLSSLKEMDKNALKAYRGF